jgi:hypothetical protein
MKVNFIKIKTIQLNFKEQFLVPLAHQDLKAFILQTIDF